MKQHKKICWLVCMLCLVTLTVCGCGKSDIAGTWYSDRDNPSALILNEDGTYTDGVWLSSGEYTVEGDEILLAGPLDGQHTLLIQKDDDGNTILYYEKGDHSHTYYRSQEQAEQVVADRKQAEEEAAEQQKAETMAALEKALPGYWTPVGEESYPMTFSEDGTYISYSLVENYNNVEETGTYEVTDENIVTLTRNGEVLECKASVNNDGTIEFNGGKNSSTTYEKATPIALSTDALVGEWKNYSDSLTNIFTSDVYYIDSSMLISAPEQIPYTITGDKTIEADGETQRIFLCETDTAYHLIVEKKIHPSFDETYITDWTRAK